VSVNSKQRAVKRRSWRQFVFSGQGSVITSSHERVIKMSYYGQACLAAYFIFQRTQRSRFLLNSHFLQYVCFSEPEHTDKGFTQFLKRAPSYASDEFEVPQTRQVQHTMSKFLM
jgi:hypothetical protein